MLTLKLKTKSDYNVLEYCRNYTGLFHELYFNFEESVDENFIKKVREKYDVDSWQYQSCLIEVKSKLAKSETDTLKKENKLKELLEINEFENKRHKYKVMQKISYLKNNIGKSIIFGTKALIRKISFLSNPVKDESQKERRIRKRLLRRAKKQFKENRILAVTIIGEAPQKSNRKFDFDLINKKVIFKPKQGIKIPIEFYCSENQYKELIKIQEQIGEQPITVKLDNDYIYLSYDEEKLNGFAFNESEYFKELKNISKENKPERKECYIKWIHEQESRKFYNKNVNRFIGFDLNPEYIAFVIVEKTTDDKFKILHKECISLKNLNTKLRLSSTDKNQIKQNNKRIHELGCVWKYIFKISQHFKVSNCSIEDLFFKDELVNKNSNEANRQTKNIWHRTKTINLIKKHCNTIGIKLIGVNACYSSFIGNIKHGFFDPVSAAIEVARRGIAKYLGKKFFYPELERSDLDTMCLLGLDVQNKTVSTWVKAYKLFQESELRYRQELKNFSENNFMSHKSRTISYTF